MFVVCGEALFDVFAVADTPTGMSMDARVGGSPFNVAVGLARLAQPVCFLSQVGTGFLGERLMRTLREEGVDTSTVQRSEAPTTLSLIGLDAKGVPSYSFYGEGCADRRLTPDALATLPDGVKAINFGSYATVVGPTAVTQRMLVERESRRTLIAYDPNIRLNVEPDLEVWREQIDWMLPHTQLLKVSEEDLQLVVPGTTPKAFAANALAAGVKLVVVTRGGEGAIGWTAQHEVTVPPIPVKVIDTVGAGDTFQCALLTWLAEHDSVSGAALAALSAEQLRDALGFAARAAAITCSRRGADMPRRAELA